LSINSELKTLSHPTSSGRPTGWSLIELMPWQSMRLLGLYCV